MAQKLDTEKRNLRIVGNGHAILFSNAFENVAREPEFIAHFQTSTRPYLVFPLQCHPFLHQGSRIPYSLILQSQSTNSAIFYLTKQDFGIGATHFESGVQAGEHVSIGYISGRHFSSSHSAVVWALGAWVSGIFQYNQPPEMQSCFYYLWIQFESLVDIFVVIRNRLGRLQIKLS